VLRPDLMQNHHVSDPGKRGRQNASMGRLRALYGAQNGHIYAIEAISKELFSTTIENRQRDTGFTYPKLITP
ncbi:MAG: hypothetical protein LUQ31_03915, partial [Methanoregula sp.]|nr:hypothetical protein [Methanoregula sp.]